MNLTPSLRQVSLPCIYVGHHISAPSCFFVCAPAGSMLVLVRSVLSRAGAKQT